MKNGKKNGLMSYEQLHELLQMTALQTAQNAKQLEVMRKEFNDELRKSTRKHDREMQAIRTEHRNGMKDIRVQLKNVIKHIAY